MPAPRAAVCAALLTFAVVTLAGCGDAAQSGDTGVGTPSASTSPSGAEASPGQEEPMKIHIVIVIGDQRFRATIFDSAAGRDLIAQLPLTIDMTDHGSVEKTGPLSRPLSLDGQPDGADPDPADVGYYAPGDDLVFYYGDQSYHPGIVIIGRLDGDAASRIADMDGDITATVEVHTG
jgi:hypothetical protein